MLQKIREIKSQPSLKDSIAEFMKKKDEKDKRKNGRIKEKAILQNELMKFKIFEE